MIHFGLSKPYLKPKGVVKIRSLKLTEDSDETHIVSVKRVFANVTLFTMLGLGFMYQQATDVVKMKLPKTDQQTRLSELEEAREKVKQQVAKEKIEKNKIGQIISSYRSSLTESDVTNIASVIHRESKKYNYDWKLILAIISTESQFDAQARSSKDARGLMQVLPSTAEWLAPKLGMKYAGHDSLYDPECNIKLGTHYLNMLHRKYGNIDKAIAAYNRGPSGLARYLRQGRQFPSRYLVKVMECYKEMKDSLIEYAS